MTPGNSSDILEGINRKTILELAERMGIKTVERAIDLTELYAADEVFACGTSSFIAPIMEIDARRIEKGTAPDQWSMGPVTRSIQEKFADIMSGKAMSEETRALLTLLKD